MIPEKLQGFVQAQQRLSLSSGITVSGAWTDVTRDDLLQLVDSQQLPAARFHHPRYELLKLRLSNKSLLADVKEVLVEHLSICSADDGQELLAGEKVVEQRVSVCVMPVSTDE